MLKTKMIFAAHLSYPKMLNAFSSGEYSDYTVMMVAMDFHQTSL